MASTPKLEYQVFLCMFQNNSHYEYWWVSKVLKYPKKCLEDLTTFFMSTWWGDSKNMKEIEFSQWLFELPAKQHSQFSPSGSTFLPCLGLPSKSHCENSISSIFLESPHQIDMKNVVKSSKHFFGYCNTLENHSELYSRSVNFRMNSWSHRFSQSMNQKL